MLKDQNRHFILAYPRETGIRTAIFDTMIHIVSLYYKLKMNICYPHEDSLKKYNVSICAIFKNEGPYLQEWLEYHKLIGIDHFYMYNNFSDDSYENILEPYIKEGTVTLTDWPYEHSQLKAYDDCISNFSSESKWIGFIDLDEFIVPVEDNDIYSFLQKFEKNRPAVLIYWRIFGSSGLISRDKKTLVTESFTSCWDKYDAVGKCFLNTKYHLDTSYSRNNIFHHHLWASYKGHFFPPVNVYDKVCFNQAFNPVRTREMPVQINHYFTKSYDEYTSKRAKGDVYFKINPHDEQYFFNHEVRCTSADFKISKYILRLKLNMRYSERDKNNDQ